MACPPLVRLIGVAAHLELYESEFARLWSEAARASWGYGLCWAPLPDTKVTGRLVTMLGS